MKTPASLIDEARRCAQLFRLGQDIEAALKMVDLVDAAVPIFADSQERHAAWTHVLGAILQCQERQDWIGVADWLEYDLVGLLKAN